MLSFSRLLLTLWACAPILRAEDLALSGADRKSAWTFDYGAEFPGAKGALDWPQETLRGQPVLRLHGDFTGGGMYVQAATDLPPRPLAELAFAIKLPAGAKSVPIRLIDGSGQCHQMKLKIAGTGAGGWQEVSLPIEEFFAKMGTPAALDLVSNYEKWGGANDGKWHQPGKGFVVLLGKDMTTGGDLLLSGVRLKPAAESVAVTRTVPLDERNDDGKLAWNYNGGQEFPGARGGLEAAGKDELKFSGDFTAGGAYVGMNRLLDGTGDKLTAIRLQMKSSCVREFGVRLVDGTGQCHQRGGFAVKTDGEWQDIELLPAKIAGGEHWGGANDGRWHDPAKQIEITLSGASAGDRKPVLSLRRLRAEGEFQARAAAQSFAESFDGGGLPAGWKMRGEVKVVPGKEGGVLSLKREVNDLAQETVAIGPSFEISPGTWAVKLAWSSELHSPDNSYQGRVVLEVVDDRDATIETIPLAEGSGQRDWQPVAVTPVLPAAAAKARFRISLEKTYGDFRVDGLSAARLEVQPDKPLVDRILISTKALGHLFLPGDPVAFEVAVEAPAALPEELRSFQYFVRDYRGKNLLPAGRLALKGAGEANGRRRYVASIALPAASIAEGKYHELRIEGAGANESSGFAVLPVAETKNFAPSRVPFTIRNWDGRIEEYFLLADRLGLRTMGVWGRSAPQPPYAVECPGLETCARLGAEWISGSVAGDVEQHGFRDYDEKALREGTRRFLEAYAGKGMAKLALGNEPHGTGQKVLDNVKAYRAVYEAAKAFDPKIHVMGTSVEPNEEYFKAGYQNYLDSYDFHIYESYNEVRRTMREYRALMEKYHAVKPLHSTELGLNSQGQTRLAVAREMIKKFTVFFAEGGETVSWFTIQYPDTEGKARGQSGDSHCVFDCRYNLYNPRLDAITYYQMVNGIGVKKFVKERQDPDGTQDYLFQDEQGHTFRVLWNDQTAKEVKLKVPGPVKQVAIDGASTPLTPQGGTITVSVSEDPVLLSYGP